MELKLNSGDVITIPGDCKAVIKDKISLQKCIALRLRVDELLNKLELA